MQTSPSSQQSLTSRFDVFGRITGAVSITLSALTSLLLVGFFGLFLSAAPQLYRAGFLHLLPKPSRPRAETVLDKVGGTLWWWLLARFGSMTVVGVLTWIGLLALNVPLAFTLALVAALLTIIPNIGPVLSAIPALLLALLQSPAAALWVGGLYLAIQTVESYLITPIFQQRVVSLPPALVIGAQVLMGVLFGLPGLIVATPLTATLFVLVRELYVKGTLGDSMAADPDSR
jgi:predicted PurR-regulated permease PerM